MSVVQHYAHEPREHAVRGQNRKRNTQEFLSEGVHSRGEEGAAVLPELHSKVAERGYCGNRRLWHNTGRLVGELKEPGAHCSDASLEREQALPILADDDVFSPGAVVLLSELSDLRGLTTTDALDAEGDYQDNHRKYRYLRSVNRIECCPLITAAV